MSRAVLVWAAAAAVCTAADCSTYKRCTECVGGGCAWVTKWDANQACTENPEDGSFDVKARFWRGAAITDATKCDSQAECLSTAQAPTEKA